MAFIRKKTLGGKYTPALLKKDLKSMSQAERRSFLEFFVEKRGSSVPARQRKNLHLLPLPMLFHLLDQSNQMTIEMGEVLYHAKEDMTTTAWQMPEEEKAEAESVTTEDATEQEIKEAATEDAAEEKHEAETEKQLAAFAAQLRELQRQLEELREENQEQKKKNKEEKQEFRIRLDNEKRETESARKEQRRAEARCEELKKIAENEAGIARDKIRELEERLRQSEREKKELLKNIEERHRQSEREKKELLKTIDELKKYEEKYLSEKRKQPKILIFSRIDLSDQAEELNCDICAKADALEELSWKEYAEIWNVSGTLRFADKVKIKQFSSLKITTIADVKQAIEERLRK